MADFKNMIHLIRQWLSGEMRASDERTLDAAMRDDPFAAEAMEGYRAFAEGDHAARIERLRNRLQEQEQSKRRGIVYFLPRAAAVAASVLLLGGAGWWLLQENPESDTLSNVETSAEIQPGVETESPIAQVEEKISPAMPQPETDAPTTVYQYNRQSGKLKVLPVTPGLADAEEPAARRKDADEALAEETFSIPKTDDQLADMPAIVSAPVESKSGAALKPSAESVMPGVPAGAAGSRAREDAKKEQPADAGVDKAAKSKQYNNLRNLTGRVTNAAGEPLIGVLVQVEGAPRGASTDLEGNFNLPLSGGEQRLFFNYTGYEPLTAAINERGVVNVTMKESSVALNEVTITSKKQSKQPKMDLDQITAGNAGGRGQSVATPVTGTEDYETYLSQNLRYPDAASRQNIRGVVKLRFTVDRNGKLSNFKILQSLGYGCDDEAIRLIKEGPAWQITGSARKVQVEWEIRF